MEGYKVCVYAIAKDEAKFAARWAESMGEADAVYVLDTGSSDDTVKIQAAISLKRGEGVSYFLLSRLLPN